MCVGGISSSVKYPSWAAGENASLPSWEAHGSGAAACLQSPEEEEEEEDWGEVNNSPAGKELEEVNTSLVHSGHTLWESSQVQRVQWALPRVWPEPGA